MFEPVPGKFNFVENEHKILDFWKKNQCFDKLVQKNKENQKWSFLDGPITANNPMGVHHAWGRTYKDIFVRYHSMLGHAQRYQNGFDCQGLWVEVEVEKELGFNSKKDIEDYGIANFVQKCKDRVEKYSKIQTEQSIRLGYWMDWENSYYTMSEENNYTIWLFLKKCHEQGWIYKGKDVMPWCARCGTAISQHEIATEGYKDLTHISIYLKFPVKERENEYLLVWTTTPWTLTSNTAAAVHPEVVYVRAIKEGKVYILARNLIKVLGNDAQILEEFPGSKIKDLEYSGPFDELDVQNGVTHKVVLWDEVSDEDGSGIVHIAPGCGQEDFALGKEFKLATIAPLDESGYFVQGFNWLSGMNVASVAEPIIQNLKEKEIFYKLDSITHRYPTCWRCSSELVFRLVDEWFIRMDELRYKIMEVAKKIRWMPEYGLDLELDWLKNMHDWCISKKRYWGLALPIFECECGHFDVIGGEDELTQRAVQGMEKLEGHSPHRPWIDFVKISCSKCGRLASRIPDVGNPWLDAGIVPYSTMGYRKNRDYWRQWFPPDFITESFPGQFRNWFYSLLAMSTVMENEVPFKTIMGYAMMKDELGQEMHKSSGNAIWFEDAAEKMSVDVMRWIFASHNPFNNLHFGFTLGEEIRKKILTLWNTYSFFITYAMLDNFKPGEIEIPCGERAPLDRWLISRCHQMIQTARKGYEEFTISMVMREFEEFVEDLSNWYVRRSRRRFWKSGNDSDKISAYTTLYEALLLSIKVICPVIPFLTEEMYQNLVSGYNKNAPFSVHHCDFPEVDFSLISEKLINEVNSVIKIVKLGRAIRSKSQIKVRHPLAEIKIFPLSEEHKTAVNSMQDQILEELNVKKLSFINNKESFISYKIRPKFDVLGPKFGKLMSRINNALKQVDPLDAVKKLKAQEKISVSVDDAQYSLGYEEVVVESIDIEGHAALEDGDLLVVLDTKITPELRMEGIVRDFVRHVQNFRKDAGLDVSDRIELFLETSGELTFAIKQHLDYVKAETLAVTVVNKLEPCEFFKEITIEKIPVKLCLKKIQ